MGSVPRPSACLAPGHGRPSGPFLLRDGTHDGCAVLAPLAAGPALLATAVAPTSSALRELLDEALAHALGA
ncbi:hypothetical protein ACFU7T_00695 [Streptomyces sp. NPDC057555]|uniref:hypothetical protein n=1 Tax=Streptomyces sp. NPDC057555 TaxID=3346166 RepID=UPI0036B559DB